MLLLLIVLILFADFFATAGILLISMRLFKLSDQKYPDAIKLTVFSAVGFIPIIGPLVLIPYVFKRTLGITWRKAYGVYIVSAVLGIIMWVPTTLGLHNYVLQAFHAVGSSMSPTINESDYLITSKIEIARASGSYSPKRGEIIIFHFPKDEKLVFFNRVIGLPGDRVVIKDGQVTVYDAQNPQGFNPDKGYELPGTVTLTDTDETIPTGNVFVLGDNRSPGGSFDSRDWGLLPDSEIISVVKYRLFPLESFRKF